MSEVHAASGDDGPETRALIVTRRWLILVTSAASGGLTLLIGLAVFPRLSMTEHVVMAGAAVLLSVAVLGSRRQGFLWLTIAGLLVLVLAVVLVPAGPLRWIPLNVLITYSTCYLVLLLPRTLGLAMPVLGAATLAWLWSGRPTNVIVANLALLSGWVSVLQVLLGSLLLWWAWHGLRRSAAQKDAALRDVQERTEASIRVQERARLWRLTAARLHESVLNSIRYVLTSPDIDRSMLAREIGGERPAAEPLMPRGTGAVPDLVRALQDDPEHGSLVYVGGQVPDLALDEAVFDAVRAAGVELVRNAARHGRAQVIVVTAAADPDGRVSLTLADNGDASSDAGEPSVGRSTILGTSLEEVGATWERRAEPQSGSVSVVRFPHAGKGGASARQREDHTSFDSGRLLMTSALAGIIAAGALYYVHMAIVGPTAQRLAGLLGLAGAVIAVIVVVRRRRIPPHAALVLVLIPAMVPWFMLGDEYTCRQAAPLSPVLNTAGYAIIVIATWSGRLPGVVGLLVWSASGALLVRSIPEGCRDSASIALLNSLVVLPVVLAVTVAGTRAYQRAQASAQVAHERDLIERSSAEAALAINSELDASVRAAEDTLADIVAGAEVDGVVRERLLLLDGRIRAGIQVDPQLDGSIAVLAKSLVEMAADQGHGVSVRAITCSRDHRPVPAAVQGLLGGLLVAPSPQQPRLRAFTDGEEDYLSLLVSAAAVRAAGLQPGDERTFDDVVLDVEDASGDDGDRLTVLVSRPVLVQGTLNPGGHGNGQAT